MHWQNNQHQTDEEKNKEDQDFQTESNWKNGVEKIISIHVNGWGTRERLQWEQGDLIGPYLNIHHQDTRWLHPEVSHFSLIMERNPLHNAKQQAVEMRHGSTIISRCYGLDYTINSTANLQVL